MTKTSVSSDKKEPLCPILNISTTQKPLYFLDNRILEYNFDEVLFSKPSDHQSIQIVATKDFGRLLILNDMANLAENDKVEYTHTLMNLPNENYGVSCNYVSSNQYRLLRLRDSSSSGFWKGF